MDRFKNLFKGKKKRTGSSENVLAESKTAQQQGQQMERQRLLLAQQEHEMMKTLSAEELEEKIWGDYMKEYFPHDHTKSYFLPPHFLICDPAHNMERHPPTVLHWYDQNQKEIGESRRRKKLRREEKKKTLQAGQRLPRRPRRKKRDPPPQPSRIFGDVFTGGGVSSVEQMLEEEHDRQRALAVINKTITISDQPMTVLSQLWFRKYLDKDEVNPDRLVNPLYFTSFNLRPHLRALPVSLKDGEGDMVFLHKHRGVLIGEMVLGEALCPEERKEKEEKERENREREEREKRDREEKEEKEKEGASGGDGEEKMDEEKVNEEKEEEKKMEEGAEAAETGNDNMEEGEDDDDDETKKKKKKEEKKRQKEKEKEKKKKEAEAAEKMEEDKEKEERFQARDQTVLLERMRRALLQIDNQEKAFVHLISDLVNPKQIPYITRMLFLPSISRDRLELALSSSDQVFQLAVDVLAKGDRQRLHQLFVCEEDMEITDGSYPSWFFQHYPGDVSNVNIEEDLYRKMLVRFVGPATTVDVMTQSPSATEVKRLGKMRWPTYSRFNRPDPDKDAETAHHFSTSLMSQEAMDTGTWTQQQQHGKPPQGMDTSSSSSQEANTDRRVAVWKNLTESIWKPPKIPPAPAEIDDDDDDDDYYHDELLYEYHYFMLDHRFRHRLRLPPGMGIPAPEDIDPANERQMESIRENIFKVMREREKKRRIRRKREDAKRRWEELTYKTLDEVYLPKPPKPVRRHLDLLKGESPLKVSAIPLTPTQMSVLSELPMPKYAYLQGPPGCGKSVVLLMKALAWARQGKPVVLVVQGDRNACAMILLERQLVDMLGDKAHLVSIYRITFEPNLKVRSEVARIWRTHGREVMIIIDQTIHMNTKEFISWLVEIRKTGPDTRIWMCDDWVRDRSQHESVRLPQWFECRDVREYRRYTKDVALMVQSRLMWVHTAFLHPPKGELPLQPLRHHGIHEAHGTSDECNYCAHNVALLLNHLKVGQPGGELQFRDVMIIVCSLYNHYESRMLTSLRDDHGFPVVRIRGTPLKDGDVHEIALGVTDQIIMTGIELAHGVGRKVVLVCDPDKMNNMSYQAMARAHFLVPCIDAPRRERI